MSYTYDYIESVLKVDDRYYIKQVKSDLSHYNYVHCGVEILSTSKHVLSRGNNHFLKLSRDKSTIVML